jgi:hypothetical protein
VNQEGQRKYRCPVCGGRISGFPPDHPCAGVLCLDCDWVGAVTTNPRHPVFDPTPYAVYVEWSGQDRLRVFAKVGTAMCFGAKTARELLEDGRPVRTGANVNEVRRLFRVFRDLGLSIRVEPKFPWGWEPSPAERGDLPDRGKSP